MLILGIETSCDETSIAVVSGGNKILSNVTNSSLPLHKRYGGVVPEIACRHHAELINIVLDRALKKARASLRSIDAVGVTQGPGLVGALLIGISLAKALSYSLKIPLITVNHLKAHLYSAIMNKEKASFPAVGLIVSGGHSSIVSMNDVDNIELLGQTRDDAAGEVFDKVAKILNLGYPGGPIIEKTARKKSSIKIRFSRSSLDRQTDTYDFSFSGIKTAVLYYVQGLKKAGKKPPVSDICASFQETVVDMLVNKTILACCNKKIRRIVVGGGVSANSFLRSRLLSAAERIKADVLFPAPGLYTDNAAMVAGLAFHLYKKGALSDYAATAKPDMAF